MQFSFSARADWRVLGALFVGAGAGLSLGGACLTLGLTAGQHDREQVAAVQAAPHIRTGSVVAKAVGQATLAGSLRTDLLADHGPLQLGSRTSEADCLTQAVYYEARGETSRGQAAVAQVILNRVKHPAFPKTVCGVVYQGAAARRGCQFSFACDGSVRRTREAGAWNRAHKVAMQALSGAVIADIGAATHFHTTQVSPNWGPRMLRTAQVGMHIFYRFGTPRVTPRDLDVAPDDLQMAMTHEVPKITVSSAPLVVPALTTAEPAKPASVQPATLPAMQPIVAKAADAAAKPTSDVASAS